MSRLMNAGLFVLACLVALPLCLRTESPMAAFWLITFVLGGLLAARAKVSARLCVTLTVSEILADVLQAFKMRVPPLRWFAHDFSADPVKFNQQIIAHLPTLPQAYDHVAANGYNNNAQNARDLLVDVPITIDGWKDVPIKILATDASQDRSQNYLKTISNAGYVLGKAVVDYALSKVLAANFSRVTVESLATTDKDTLSTVREDMNLRSAGEPRFGLVNSQFASALTSDPRIASGDFHGQMIQTDPYMRLTGVEGFQEIREYPGFPANAQNLSAFFFDERAIGIATRLPADSTNLARQMGIPVNYTAEVIQDPETGLALIGFAWIDSNTHNIYVTVSVMYGAVAGSQAGAAGDKTDYAGHRVRTS